MRLRNAAKFTAIYLSRPLLSSSYAPSPTLRPHFSRHHLMYVSQKQGGSITLLSEVRSLRIRKADQGPKAETTVGKWRSPRPLSHHRDWPRAPNLSSWALCPSNSNLKGINRKQVLPWWTLSLMTIKGKEKPTFVRHLPIQSNKNPLCDHDSAQFSEAAWCFPSSALSANNMVPVPYHCCSLSSGFHGLRHSPTAPRGIPSPPAFLEDRKILLNN